MRQAYVAQDLQKLLDLLNRPAARTYTKTTPLSLAVFDTTQTLATTVFLDVHWPIETGTVLRYAKFLPSQTVTHSGSAFATYATVAVGLRKGTKFDVVGNVYDSRTRDLTVGVPLTLFNDETEVPTDRGIAVRVVFVGWPIPALVGSSIETFFGYQG